MCPQPLADIIYWTKLDEMHGTRLEASTLHFTGGHSQDFIPSMDNSIHTSACMSLLIVTDETNGTAKSSIWHDIIEGDLVFA